MDIYRICGGFPERYYKIDALDCPAGELGVFDDRAYKSKEVISYGKCAIGMLRRLGFLSDSLLQELANNQCGYI
jgi:hypothetical protein